MNVLSLFDGMSCGRIALDRAGIKVNNYYASEIKKHAIKCALDNYPDIKYLGDVKNIHVTNFGIEVDLPHSSMRVISDNIDLLIGGSPCQDISNLKTGGDVYSEKSRLFFEYLRIKKELNPKYFLLENVVGDKESIKTITNLMEVEPIRINSSLVSFQKRDRYYWTNIPGVSLPEDKKISFQDYKDTDEEYLKLFKVNKTPSRINMWESKCPNVTHREKINCLTCKQDRWNNAGLIEYQGFCRYLTTRELELAQNVPIGYTKSLSINQAADLLGDGWTVDVIAHIFKGLTPPQSMGDKEG